MKTLPIYLVTVTIYDGEHEHYDRCLVHAKSILEAGHIANAVIKPNEDSDEQGLFDYGDGTTECAINHIQDIDEKSAKVLSDFGVADYIN